MYKEEFDVQDIMEVILVVMIATEIMMGILVASTSVTSMMTFDLAIIISVMFGMIVGAIAFIIKKLTE